MEGREGGSFARKLIISLLLARRYIVLASLTCDLDEMVSNRNDSSNELYIYIYISRIVRSRKIFLRANRARMRGGGRKLEKFVKRD